MNHKKYDGVYYPVRFSQIILLYIRYEEYEKNKNIKADEPKLVAVSYTHL